MPVVALCNNHVAPETVMEKKKRIWLELLTFLLILANSYQSAKRKQSHYACMLRMFSFAV